MAPSSGSRRKVKARTRKPGTTRKIHCKKHRQQQHVKPNNLQEALAVEDLPFNPTPTASANSSTCSKMGGGVLVFEGSDDDIAAPSGCSTPKAHRFRIPEIATCPPAPKKQRVMPNFSLQRRPIAFFAPPDLELFFFFALSDISV